jgi:N-acetylmuramoyl-L-alanine amidase/putative methionine-R-sulfoxide reductase with GAF domain
MTDPVTGTSAPDWRKSSGGEGASGFADYEAPDAVQKPSQMDALQALLAFSALHEQVRRRKALAARHRGFDSQSTVPEFEPDEHFVLDEVLQLVAQRAVAITGADGLAIALAENNEIVLRAAAGTIRPDVGARIERDSAFSGAAFRTAQIVSCDDTETDPRVNLQACRKLGARSMVAVPLCGRRRVIGLLEAFSSWPFAFNESDVRNLSLLAELVLAALKPEDEDRFAESAQVASTKLEPPAPAVVAKVIPVVTSSPAAAVVPPIAATAATPPKPAAPKIPVAVSAAPLAAASVATPVAPSAATPAAPEIKPVEAPTVPGVAAAEIVGEPAAEPELTLGQPEVEESSHRPWMLILLVCIVIGTAFAGGVWWKLKTEQLGSAMVPAQPIPVQASKPAEKPASTSSTPANASPATETGSAADAIDSGEPDLSPAAPQELTKFPHVTGIRHWSSPDSSSVVLDLEDQVQYEAHRLTGPDRIYFDLHDTQLAAALVGKSIEVGDTLLNRIRVAQPVAGMTRIVLETRADTNFSVSLEPNPYRLIVEVRKIGVTPKGAVNLFPSTPETEKSKLAIVIPPPTKEDLQLRARVPKMRIVVDAGHGGWDLGTVGRRGLLEKDLVLEIAQRLGKLLESRLGADVIYTRKDDNYIPLDERAEIANQAQADLFVSVHANYSDLPSARGVETYYTNFFSAPGSKDAGSKDADTHAVAGAAKNPVTPTLTPADLHERIEQSRRLASSVQRSLYGTLSGQNPGLRDRGIKEAGFVVLTESAMPGILAEVSFVSSPTDEQKLRSDGYREQIAEALYRGIAKYAATSKSVKMASK